MATYDLGDGVPLEHEVYDADGVLTDATVALTLIRPDGSTFPAPAIAHLSTGLYRAVPVPDAVGPWLGTWVASGAVVSVRPISFAVADPAPAIYASLPAVKEALGKETTDNRDDLIQQAISAASRLIDRRCGRRFYADRTASTRVFSAPSQTLTELGDQALLVDDIASLTDLAVATGCTGSWTTVDTWEAGPDNALAYGRPITQIRSAYGWMPSLSRVQVTARWGWPTVPDEISQATQLLAARLYRRKDSPQGVMGSADWGFTRVSRTDPDVEALIAPFIRPIVF